MDDKTRKQFDRWISDWRSGLTHISDLTLFAEDLIVEWGTLESFYASPDEIKNRIGEHVAEYERTGESSYIVSGTGDTIDRAAKMKVIADLLKQAKLKT